METHLPTRDETWALLSEFNSSPSLLNHALGVEAVMRALAKKAGADEEKWGVIGLIHDLDYERFPEVHCAKTKEVLTTRGWPEEYIRAVMAHGFELCTDVKPESPLEKTLYAIDELVGFVVACALVRPSKSVMDLEVSSVKKKWKQKGFAAGANRTVIEKGAAMLGIGLDELIADTIGGLRSVAAKISL